MSFQRDIRYYRGLFVNKAATGVSLPVDARDFKYAQVTLAASNNGATAPVYTVKIRASLQDVPPNFALPASQSNEWAYVQFKDLDAGTAVDNIAISAAGLKQLQLLTDGIAWFAIEISAYTSGYLNANATVVTNL